MKKKRPRIGLVLAGGGAKGSYQVGVWKAICEYGLDKKIDCIAANSIGSLNTLMFMQYSPDECIDIWRNIDNKVVMSKSSLLTKIKTKSLFSRDGVRKLLEEKIDASIYQNLKMPIYITTTDVDTGKACYFKLNGKSKDEIFDIVLASSAIPGVFENVNIAGGRFMDGLAANNVPTKPLLNLDCEMLFVIPLNGQYKVTEKELSYNIPIISFDSPYTPFGFKGGTLTFKEEFSLLRIDHGYHVAKQLLDKLRKEGVIAVTKWEKFKRFFHKKKIGPFYGLSKDEIEHKIIFRKK